MPYIQFSSPLTVEGLTLYPVPAITQLRPAASPTMHIVEVFFTIVIFRWYPANFSCPAISVPTPEPAGLPIVFWLKNMKGMRTVPPGTNALASPVAIEHSSYQDAV